MADTQGSSVSGNRVVWDITQPAEEPQKPYQPRPTLYGAAAGLFGLILGLLLAIALELLDTTLKTPSEVKQYLGMNTFGVIPGGRGSGVRGRLTANRPLTPDPRPLTKEE